MLTIFLQDIKIIFCNQIRLHFYSYYVSISLLMISKKDKRNFLIEIGQLVKSKRESLDITQSELARLTDKDRQNINRLEKGYINPSIVYLKELADGMQIELSDLLLNKK